MILIEKVEQYAAHLLEKVEELKSKFIVIDDSQLARVLKDLRGSDNLVLVGFIPSHQTEGKTADDVQNIDSMLWLVLSKFDKSDGQDSFIQEMKRLQLAANELQKQMLLDKANFFENCGLHRQLQVPSIRIDPIWDLFSFIGYEVEYTLKTPVF